MPTIALIVILLFLVFFYCVGLLDRKFKRSTITIYRDAGRGTKPLKDNINFIQAIPDWIIKAPNAVTLYEYKSRSKRLYESDIVQTLASVLAARGAGYAIDKAVVETADKKHPLKLGDNEKLLRRIHKPLEAARLVARGGVPQADPKKHKCTTCGFKTKCQYAQLS